MLLGKQMSGAGKAVLQASASVHMSVTCSSVIFMLLLV